MPDPRRDLDIALMRTLMAVGDLGSFARAAQRIGRSESAVSLQIKRLEEIVGRPLFRRDGRGVSATEVGDRLLGHARRLIALNDGILDDVAGPEVTGTVRLGVPPDLAESWLPTTLVQFARRYPSVRIATTIERSSRLIRQAERGELDLTLAVLSEVPAGALWSVEMPMCWIGPRGFRKTEEDLKLVVFDRPCFFRAAATAALDEAGIAWRIAFTSANLTGLWAAVGADLGITVRAAAGLPSQLAPLGPAAGLPPLPSVFVALIAGRDGAAGGAARSLSETVMETIAATAGGAF